MTECRHHAFCKKRCVTALLDRSLAHEKVCDIDYFNAALVGRLHHHRAMMPCTGVSNVHGTGLRNASRRTLQICINMLTAALRGNRALHATYSKHQTQANSNNMSV